MRITMCQGRRVRIAYYQGDEKRNRTKVHVFNDVRVTLCDKEFPKHKDIGFRCVGKKALECAKCKKILSSETG